MAQESKRKRLFLLDGSALAYRAYFAFIRNPLINSRGENVSMLFGFTKIILNVLDQEQPDYFAIVFDTPEPTFRHKLYVEYKAQRKEMPEDMIDQLPRIQELAKALDLPIISKPGYEADDIMGTLSKQAGRLDVETVLVTGDKDLMQLVNKNTRIYNPRRSGEEAEWLDEERVTEKMGVPPGLIIDYLALCGDSSDNIPGVSGIGPVGAVKLLQEYGSLAKVLENADKIENKRARESLKENGKLADLSYKLATIHCDVALETDIDSLLAKDIDSGSAVAFFKKMEIPSLVDRFAKRQKTIETKYQLVNTPGAFKDFIEQLSSCAYFAFDTETTDVDPLRAELVGLSFSWTSGAAHYIPVKMPAEQAQKTPPLDKNMVLDRLRPIFEDGKIHKCAHNAKYDIMVLENEGVYVKGLKFDTMIASYLINPSGHQHNLDAVSMNYLDFKKIPTGDLIGSGKSQRTMDQVDIEKVKEYACEDADITWRLQNVLTEKIKTLNLSELFHQVELPLIYVLARMERNGVDLDELYLANMSGELKPEMDRLQKKIYKIAGGKFNINSPKQLSSILFEKLKLPTFRRTKTGYSTDVSVLEELARSHELPRRILEYRQLTKLKSTYVDALPRLMNPKTGRVHTSYNQTVTATGRLSSSDPNLQNIPIRTEMGRRIRRAFIPGEKDHVILDADYSQIELRIMAHLSGDDTLRRAFLNDEDVHIQTAALVFKVEPNQVTPDQRRKAKEVNFGIMYGMGAYGLSRRLDISAEEAESFIHTYFAYYPGVQEYMLRIVREAREKGYVTTLLNRRRYLPEINSDNRRIREFAERTAINTPIQGSAADLIKVAMIRIQKKLSNVFKTMMIIQVHDELVFEVPYNELKEIQALVREEMENAIRLNVPVKADIAVGNSWLDAH